jgi:hypothetical protein
MLVAILIKLIHFKVTIFQNPFDSLLSEQYKVIFQLVKSVFKGDSIPSFNARLNCYPFVHTLGLKIKLSDNVK